MFRILHFLILFFSTFCVFSQNKITISGTITEKGSREQLIGVNVYILGNNNGTSSNQFGYYSLTIPAQDFAILVAYYFGYQPVEIKLPFNKRSVHNNSLESNVTLNEVELVAKKQADMVSDNVQMGQIEIPTNQIKKILALLGEKDVLKVLQLIPRVQKG